MKEANRNEDWEMEIIEMLRIANQAAAEAQTENKKYGLPRLFVRNGVLYYELPNGEITREKPEILR